MEIIEDLFHGRDLEERHDDSIQWRKRVERAIKYEVMTAHQDDFLIQVTDKMFVFVHKNGKQIEFKWQMLRGKVSLDRFFWIRGEYA